MTKDYNPAVHEVYDPDFIYSRSSNRYGVSGKTPRVNAPHSILGAVNSLIQQNRELGYGSMEAFIRDAICHRLHYWQEKLVDAPPAISVGLMQAKIEANEEKRESATNLVQSLLKQYDTSNTEHERIRARTMILEAIDLIQYQDLKTVLETRCGGKTTNASDTDE